MNRFTTHLNGEYCLIASDDRIVIADSDGVLTLRDGAHREGFRTEDEAIEAALYYRSFANDHCHIERRQNIFQL